jgi:hypothetical protein
MIAISLPLDGVNSRLSATCKSLVAGQKARIVGVRPRDHIVLHSDENVEVELTHSELIVREFTRLGGKYVSTYDHGGFVDATVFEGHDGLRRAHLIVPQQTGTGTRAHTRRQVDRYHRELATA